MSKFSGMAKRKSLLVFLEQLPNYSQQHFLQRKLSGSVFDKLKTTVYLM